jgi:NADH dehydrogenase (ubiquinone) 1 alpha subcomplex subunit 10
MDPDVLEALPKPWPYETTKFTWAHQYILRMDRCVKRFTENTKVIVVEGNIGAGKSKFAKELADQLGMRHFPEPTLDELDVDRDGFDWRTLNWRLPEWGRLPDVRTFYEKPDGCLTGSFQAMMYKHRYFQYVDALAHLYNTGQGVVLERCPWTDIVFLDAGWKMNWIKDDARRYMMYLRKETESVLQRPHLLIYLDVPVETCLERVKQRNIPYEVKSKAMTTEYLGLLEDSYKNLYLPEITKHAELIVYDWSNYGDMDLVVEDLEKLDFQPYEARGEKMEDWRMYIESDYDDKRRLYTNNQEYEILCNFHLAEYDTPSLCMPDEVAGMVEDTYLNFGPKYSPNWNPEKVGWLKVLLGRDYNYREKQKWMRWQWTV